MSTHAYIGRTIVDDDLVEWIYCHIDGYPSHITPTLLQYYNTPEMVDKLIHLGDISCIYANIAPPKGAQHTFDNPFPNTTVAYFRDRNEPWKDNKSKYDYRTGFMNIDNGYKYLYDTKTRNGASRKENDFTFSKTDAIYRKELSYAEQMKKRNLN